MTRSSDRGGCAEAAYARFIPREELDGFAAWRPNAFGDTAAAARRATETQRGAEQQARAPERATRTATATAWSRSRASSTVLRNSWRRSWRRW